MVSVIIPAYNEEKALPETLRHLFRQSGEYEVLVVDGGSVDGTCEIVQREPRAQLVTASKGRAIQMNTGAKHATGTWLLFLHADTVLPYGAIERINAFTADPSIQAGGFLQSFSGDDWRLRLVSRLDNFRCHHSRIIYGDQALFVRRTLFERLSGFPEQPILEDVTFCEKLVRATTPVLLAPPVITDSRKFVTMGVWRSLARVLLIILHLELRVPILPRAFFRDIR